MNKILVAEDEEILREVLKDRLVEDGWNVITAEDGSEALSKIEHGKFDLILLDLLMPKKSGVDVLKEGVDAIGSTPVVVLSNLGSDEDIKRALNLSADNYFVKTQHAVGEIIDLVRDYQKGGFAKKHRK